MTATRRAAVGGATVAVAVLGLTALRAGYAHPDEALGGGARGALALQLAAGLGAWAAGLYAVTRLRATACGRLLAAAGIAVFLTELPAPALHSSALFTAALAGGALVGVLAGAAALAYVAPALDGVARVVATGALLAVALLEGIVPALLFDPRASGCFTCPPNRLLVHADLGLHDLVARWGLRATVVSGVVLAAVALARWWRAAPPVRALAAPVVLAGAAAAALNAAAATHALAQVTPVIDATARSLWLAQSALLLGMAVGIGGRVLLAARLRDRVADIVVGALPDADGLRRALAESIGDPRLDLVFPRESAPAVAADGGVAAPPAADQAVLAVNRGERVIAELRHERALSVVPERLAGAVRAGGLALEHAAGRATLRAELEELSASRARIVAVGDAERRRLERDLHDGAQQRLIAIAISLQGAHDRATDPIAREALSAARYEVRRALDELRAIAHGIHPVTLTDAGLGPALRELAEGVGVPVRLERLPDGCGDPPAEAAAYRLIADAVSCAERAGGRTPVRVRVAYANATLRAEVQVGGGDPAAYEAAVADAADRARALGGDVSVTDGVDIDMHAPCGS